MLLFFSISGFVLSFLILYFNARKYRSSIYLALFFLLESLYLLAFYAGFYEILPAPFLYIAPPGIALIYSIVAAFLLFRWVRQGKTKMVLHQQKYLIRWLTVLLIIVSLTLVSHIAPMNIAYSERKIELFFSLKVLMSISAAGLTGLLISILFLPQILYGLPFIPNDFRKNEKENTDEKQVGKDTGTLKQKADSKDEYMKQIGDKTDQCMREHRFYLQQDGNLTSFARTIKVPAHHLAYYFREVRKQPC
ncbi:MAG: hypothetical protein JXA03_06275 [Bacteroidales bacterium]|nr:hypothetical protein [Bacteroidales bacterium]